MTTLETPHAALLFGIDAVDLDRACFGSADERRRLARTVLSDDEHHVEHPTDALDIPALAAALAVKEAMIKAVGGRDHPFDWRAIELFASAAPLPLDELGHVVDGLRDVMPDGDERWGTCRIGRSTSARARALLGVAEWEPLRALAAWRTDAERVVAVVTVGAPHARPGFREAS